MIPFALEGCRAWFHPGRSRGAVVLCSGLGIEELCARQSYRVLAGMLSQRGLGVLRLDYFGTGDSLGDLGATDLPERWLADIERAALWLEGNGHAQELTFVGMRLGATLAARAGAARGGIARLVMLAPAASGRAYARELQMSSRMLVTMGSGVGARHNDGPGTDVAGFVFPPDFAAACRRLDSTNLAEAPAPRVLIASPDGLAGAVGAAIEASGVEVTHMPFPDYARMMINPTSGHPCMATMTRVADWIAAGIEPTPGPAVTPGADVIRGPGWIEHARVFADDDHRCGILCEPTSQGRGAVCALLLNGGRDSHVGWARGTVELARQLAAAGIASLRFDLTRVADSQPDLSGRRADLYRWRGVSGYGDIEAAIAALEARGYKRFAIFGSCSGAYLALRAGLHDPRIDAIAVRNIQRLVWGLDDRMLFPLQERIESSVGAHRGIDAEGVGDGAKASTARHLLRFAFHAAQAVAVAVAGVAGVVMRDRARLRGAIARFNRRGGRLVMVYSDADPGRAHLDRMLGRDGMDITGGANVVQFVADADHNFSSAAHRRWFGRQMIELIESASTTSDAGPDNSSPAPAHTASPAPASCARR